MPRFAKYRSNIARGIATFCCVRTSNPDGLWNSQSPVSRLVPNTRTRCPPRDDGSKPSCRMTRRPSLGGFVKFDIRDNCLGTIPGRRTKRSHGVVSPNTAKPRRHADVDTVSFADPADPGGNSSSTRPNST
ncbi:hypothetical protein [Burkholderia cenocepacia]|uniref:hypothetical protein n=1 Tax=Burkholderia cenocepacia TaxID=95486 RepID=UPI002AAF9094|nr:hypothetical protein [Burkholderia cenocepacia]